MHRQLSYLSILIATLIWGISIPVYRWGLSGFSPIWFAALRLLTCTLVALPFLLYWKSFIQYKERLLIVISISICLFIASFTQIVAVEYTTVARASFLTASYILFTPIISFFLTREAINPKFFIILFFSVIFMGMLCNLDMSSVNGGDLVALVAGFFYALRTAIIDRAVHHFKNIFEFNLLQVFFAGIIATIGALSLEGGVSLSPLYSDLSFSDNAFTGLIIASFGATILCFSLTAWAQRHMRSHEVSMVILAESPIAAFFAWVFFRETMSPMSIAGAALLLLTIMIMPKVLKESKKPEIESKIAV